MSMAMTLPPGDVQRWEQHKEKVGTAKAYVTDLEQNLGFVTSGRVRTHTCEAREVGELGTGHSLHTVGAHVF